MTQIVKPILKDIGNTDLLEAPATIQFLHLMARQHKTVPASVLSEAMSKHPDYFGEGKYVKPKVDMTRFGKTRRERRKNYRSYKKEYKSFWTKLNAAAIKQKENETSDSSEAVQDAERP